MDKLKEIRSLDDLKEFIKLNKDVLKKSSPAHSGSGCFGFFLDIGR